MVHSEAVNRMLRQLVRDSPDNPTPINLPEYPWVRYNSLPALKTLLPVNIEDATPSEILVAQERLKEQSLQPMTFIASLAMTQQGLLIVLGPLNGTYDLTHLKIELISSTTAPDILWQLYKCNFFPTTLAQAVQGRLIFPYRGDAALNDAISQRAADRNYVTSVLYPYEDDYLAFAAAASGVGAEGDYLQITVTLKEL